MARQDLSADVVRYIQSASAPPASRQGGPAGLPIAGPPAALAPAAGSPPSDAATLLRSRAFRRAVLIAIGLVVGLILGVLVACALGGYAAAHGKERDAHVTDGAHERDVRDAGGVADVRDAAVREAFDATVPTLPSSTPTPILCPPAARTTTAPSRMPKERVLLPLALLLGVVVGRKTSASRRKKAVPQIEQPTGTAEKAMHRHLGACSHVGNTREENQDRVCVECIAGAEVIAAADGLGGPARGAEAAEIACTTAMERLRRELPQVLPAGVYAVRSLLLALIWEAGLSLAREAHAKGWTGVEAGLRTTLILVVALPDAYLTAYIGDGGVFLLREGSDDIISLLQPHKNAGTPDLLEASLGPVTEGRPAWAVTLRHPGDLLVAATDGIADRFDPELAASVRKSLKRSRGNAQKATEKMVEEIAALRDGGGFLVTDNLTLAVLTTESAS